MDIADCYRVLGLTSMATAQEVKSSYRRLARQWHPDVNPNNQHAHDMFIRVTEAYKVLLAVAPSSSPVSNPPPSTQSSATASEPRTNPQPRSSAAQPNPYPTQKNTARSPQPSSQNPGSSSSYYRQAAAPQTSQPKTSQAGSGDRPDPSYEIKLRAYEQLQGFIYTSTFVRARI